MRTRLVVIGLMLLGSGALAINASAQPAPPRVVQSSDGSLFVVQGANAWPLVPDPIDDAELGALNLGGEVDGTLPANLLTAAAPASPPPPAAAPTAPPPPTDVAPVAPADTAPPAPATNAPPPPLRRGVPTPAVAAPAGSGTSKQRPAGPTPTPDPYGK